MLLQSNAVCALVLHQPTAGSDNVYTFIYAQLPGVLFVHLSKLIFESENIESEGFERKEKNKNNNKEAQAFDKNVDKSITAVEPAWTHTGPRFGFHCQNLAFNRKPA